MLRSEELSISYVVSEFNWLKSCFVLAFTGVQKVKKQQKNKKLGAVLKPTVLIPRLE